MESTGSYRLTVRQGPVPGKTFELAKDVMTIGRDVNNDIVINDAEISRNHARLTAQSGGYLMEDLASTNGTFVNGQRLIGPRLLSAGDSIGLGETVVLEYSYAQPEAGATMIAGSGMRAAQPPPPAAPPPMAAPPPPVYMPEPEPEPAAPLHEAASTVAYDQSPAYDAAPAYGAAAAYEPVAPQPPPLPVSGPIPAPLPQAPKKSNRNLIIGGVCGCLTLCACASAAVAVWQFWPQIAPSLGLQ